MSEENQPNQGAENQQPQQQFALQRIYVKDLSFESPMGINGQTKPWKPQVNQDISTKTQKLDNDLYDVVLHLTITIKLEDEVAVLVEIQQAGLFRLVGFDQNQLTQILNTHCLQVIFPYARETIDSMLVKGGFPAIMLPPINFDALFAQAVAQQQAKQAEQADPTVN